MGDLTLDYSLTVIGTGLYSHEDTPKKEYFIKVIFSILLLILSLALLEGALRLSAVGYHYFNKDRVPPASIQIGDRLTILCIGESTTAWGLNEAYPTFLQNKLDAELGEGKYLVVNGGITGTDTQEILKNLNQNIQTYQPQIVISMMGINDWWGLQEENHFYDNFRIYKFSKILMANLNGLASDSQAVIIRPAKTNPVVDGEPVLLAGQPELEMKINSGLKNYNEKKFLDAITDFKYVEQKKEFPNSVYYWLARSYFSVGKKDEAMRYFKLYETSGDKTEVFLNIAHFFSDNSGQFDKTSFLNTKKYLDLAFKSAPENSQVLKMMGIWHIKNKNPGAAKPLLEKAAAHANADALTLLLLARIYVGEGHTEQAIALFKRGLNDETESGRMLWGELLQTLMKEKKLEEAQRYYALAVERYPNEKIFLARIRRLGIPGVSFEKWDSLAAKNQIQNYLLYPPTRRNYEKFAEVLQEHGITYVAMQYPLRDTEELKNLLMEYPGTLFVDNRTNFENALKTASYDDLFMDRFAQDFGHFTPRGAELVANQVFAVLKNEKVFENHR